MGLGIVRFGLLFCGLLTVGFGLVPEKRRPHERLRERLHAQPEVERWFMPGELGHEAGVEPPALSEQAFLTRALGGVTRANDGEWAKFNRLTSRLNFSHNLKRVFPPELYTEHPVFFPEINGRRASPAQIGLRSWQPDLGSPAVAAYAAERAREYFAEKPEAVSFALGVNDSLVFGESAETLALITPAKWFRGRPDYSNLVFTFMNRAAGNLSSTHPDKYLGALAYYWAENTPDFPVHPQVIPFLTADRSQGYDREFWREDRLLQKRWVEALNAYGNLKRETANLKEEEFSSGLRSQTSGLRSQVSAPISKLSGLEHDSSFRSPVSGFNLRLGLYDYLYGQGFLIPRMHTRLLAEHLHYTRRLGFTDYYAEMTPNWGLDGPQPWLVAQLLQNPEQNAERLLDEYYRRYFKEVAAPMRQFFERCEAIWMGQQGESYWLKFYRNEMQAELFPPAVCRELRAWLDAAAEGAASDLVRQRVQQVSDAFGVTERFTQMQHARLALNRLTLRRGASADALMAALLAFRRHREDFLTYTTALQKSQPLLIAPFRETDYLAHDPTVQTLIRVREISGDRALSKLTAGDPALTALVEALTGEPRSLLKNGNLSGLFNPPRMIAGLAYDLGAPFGWHSKVEPAQHFEADWILGKHGCSLRLSGSNLSSLFQWSSCDDARMVVGGMQVRGSVSTTAGVYLMMTWMDDAKNELGVGWVRLPPGDWPGWVQLRFGDLVPAGAKRVSISLAVNHQRTGDWVEVRNFELEARGRITEESTPVGNETTHEP